MKNNEQNNDNKQRETDREGAIATVKASWDALVNSQTQNYHSLLEPNESDDRNNKIPKIT